MKKQILLLALAIAQLHAGTYNRPERTNDGRSTNSAIPRRSAGDTTPGRRSQGFSSNAMLNWRHPYMNR